MFNFFQKPFFCFSLITACVLSCYQPEVALASHHHVKKFKTVSHHHPLHKKSSSATTQTATNVDFIINPDNSVVANNAVIPAVTATETTNVSSAEPTVAAAVETRAEVQTTSSVPEHTHTLVTETTQPKNVIAVKSESRLIPFVERIFTPVRAAPVYITKETVATTHVLGNFATSMHRHLVDFVQKTVETLRYSDYKLGGSKFDTSRGVYVVDCSSFVDNILKQVSPHAYTSLVNATGAPTPATQHYYEFFNELSSNNSDNYWNKVTNVEQLRAGDILVFRTKQSHRHAAGGHIMVVMDKPTKDMGVYFVRVADSAPSRHSEDTRQKNEAGIGIGTLMLKAAKGGRPFAYAWAIGGLWNKNVNFAMARPTEWD